MWLSLLVLLFGLFGDDQPEYEILNTDAPIGEIYYVQDKDATRTYAEVIYAIGEADMTGPEGIAHYTEHLVAWNALPESAKDKGRDFNASTTGVITNYYMISDSIEDVMSYLAATKDPITLDETYMLEEAKIVQNEFQLHDAENPYAPLEDELQTSVFQGTGLARSVIGKSDEIVEFAPQTAIDIHQNYYNLSNARMIVLSPLSKREVIDAINVAFEHHKLEEPISRPLYDERPKYEGEDSKTLSNKDIHSVQYISKFISPYPENYTDLQIQLYTRFANDILNSSKSGMIARQLEFENKQFTDISFGIYQLPAQMGLHLSMSAEVLSDEDQAPLSSYFLEWIDGVEAHKDSIDQIIENGKDNFRRDLENWQARDEFGFIQFQLYQNPSQPIPFAEFAQAAQDVTSDEVIGFLKRLASEHRVTNRIWKGNPS